MKGFTLFGVVSGLVSSAALTIMHQGHEQIFNYKSPSELFGPLNATFKARAISKRRSSRLASGNPEYYSRRTPTDCSFPFNVLVLQDSTGSFERSFFTAMGQALKVLMDEIFVDHPNSTFSIVSYQDKPINNLGERSDRCFTVDLLAANDSEVMLEHYSAIKNGGGYDWPENQFGALVASLESPTTIPWMDSELGTPLVLHITDAGPHFAGDEAEALYPQLQPYPGFYDENAKADYCTKYYYPKPWDVAQLLMKHNAYMSTLIFNGDMYNDLALDAWNWFNSLLVQDQAFVTSAEDDTLSWLAHFVEVINKIRGEECGPMNGSSTSSTTPVSDSTEASTSAPVMTTAPPSTEPGTTTPSPQGTLPTFATFDRSSESTACKCPSEDPCCNQPEFLLAILRRPSELDIHMKE